MYSIEIADKQFDLPENWSEISFGKFIELSKIINKEKSYSNGNMFVIDLLCSLMDCGRGDLYKLDSGEFNTLAQLTNYLADEPSKKLVDVVEFKVGDKEYKFHRRLNDKLNMSEMVTCETLLRQSDTIDQYAIILSILYRPTDENGNIIELEDDMDPIMKRAELLKEFVTVDKLYGVLVFFSNGVKEFSTRTLGHSSTLKIGKKVNS